MKNYEKEFEETAEVGCGFCWDKKRQKNKELFFLDAANNMRICTFCPSCGRFLEDGVNESANLS